MFKVVKNAICSQALHYVLACHVYQTLLDCGGSVKATAGRLGCGPGKVYTRMKMYGIDFDNDKRAVWPYEKRAYIAANELSAKPRGKSAKKKGKK